MRLNTDYIIIHCSATPPSEDLSVHDIRDLHAGPKGSYIRWAGKMVECFGWRDVGYHHVITRSGKLEMGRPTLTVGAHAKGYNSNSVGICLVGGVNIAGEPDCNFTRAQWQQLEKLVYSCKVMYREAQVIGHRDLPGVTKACPSFDVVSWWCNNG
jgi:hypothetical protein